MKTIAPIFLSVVLFLISSCSPVKIPATDQYQLSAFCTGHHCRYPHHSTLLVSMPEAAAAYQTEQMLYINCPYQLEVFAHNAWVSPPASMLYPLLIKSLQCTGFFYAVTSSAYGEGADFRLDTQIFNLEQNFLKKPSELEFSAKVVLTDVKSNHILASTIIYEHIPCESDTPLGGVIAANKAMECFTSDVDEFVMSHIK